ncbi:hypothetical protein MNBD_GAMMA04-1492 [hydrothermal vent metagenome]|uniref:Cytochrome C n=1 Tax=hydrothermal vent metagenome TaxID=652676 RepID=A0A3B0VV86_9ZZZZ
MNRVTFKGRVLRSVMGCFLGFSMVTPVMASESADEREVIWVSADEKAVLLSEMRAFLEASQRILEGSLADDMEVIEEAARSVGMKMMRATPKELHKKLPSGFTALGPKAHRGFEAIADEASAMGDREMVLQHLAKLQKTCNSCHSIYRFEVK